MTTAPDPRASPAADHAAAGEPADSRRPAPDPRAEAVAMRADDLVRATGGTLLRRSERPIRRGAVDSRLVEAGCLFAALPGERTDGHRFLDDAVARGAAALLVSRPLEAAALDALGDVTVVRVDDSLAGLQAIAGSWRRRFDLLVVGITGSVGKTSTKEAAAAVLGAAMPTLRSEGNQNNEVGLPLTLLRLAPEHRAAVLEMGMYVGGEIATLAALALPEVAVVTTVAPVHLERAGSMVAIEHAKAELVEALPPDGTAILNADDERVSAFAARTEAMVVRYGFGPEADVMAADVEARGAAGMAFTVVARAPRAARLRASISAMGRHSVANALAAVAVGLVAGLDDAEIEAGIAAPWGAASAHRLAIVAAPDLTILDDTYNASPPAGRAALDVLGTLPGRPVAVLGEMLELGSAHDEGHRSVGAAAAAVVAELVVIGEGAAEIARAARAAGLPAAAIHQVPDRAAAIECLAAVLRPGDVVLVKASLGVALGPVVEALRDGIPIAGAQAGGRPGGRPAEGSGPPSTSGGPA